MTTNKKQTANREITKKKKRKDSKKVGVRVRASHPGLAFSFSTPHLTPHIPTATGHPTGREAPHQPWRGLLSNIVCHEAAALTVQCLPREPRTVAAESQLRFPAVCCLRTPFWCPLPLFYNQHGEHCLLPRVFFIIFLVSWVLWVVGFVLSLGSAQPPSALLCISALAL